MKVEELPEGGSPDGSQAQSAPAQSTQDAGGNPAAGGQPLPAGDGAGPGQQSVEPAGNAAPSIEDVLKDVGSERSKERIKAWIADHNRLEQAARRTQETNDRFSQLVRNTGMAPDELMQTLEYGRLSRSGNPGDLAVALEMLENERQAIYARLGRTAPGSDPLAGFDDLKQQVEGMEMTQAAAKEVANARRFMAQQQAQREQAQQQAQQQAAQRQRYEQDVLAFQRQAMALFGQLAVKDPGFKAKEKALEAYLRAPGRMQEIMANLPPQQWAFHLKAVYDTIRPEPETPRRLATPIAAKPQSVAKPVIHGRTNEELTASVIRNYFSDV